MSASLKTKDQIIFESKIISKDDLDLLSSPKKSTSAISRPESPAFRRTQSLGELNTDEILTATVDESGTSSSCEGNLSEACILRQGSFGTDALLSNSTVSLVSVQLNSSFVEERLKAEAASANTSSVSYHQFDGKPIEIPTRIRCKSECSAVDSVATLTGRDSDDSETPLSEINRYTMCSNRII